MYLSEALQTGGIIIDKKRGLSRGVFFQGRWLLKKTPDWFSDNDVLDDKWLVIEASEELVRKLYSAHLIGGRDGNDLKESLIQELSNLI
jgi:hypothetical protein